MNAQKAQGPPSAQQAPGVRYPFGPFREPPPAPPRPPPQNPPPPQYAPPFGVIRPPFGLPPPPAYAFPRLVPYGAALGSAPHLHGLPPPAPLQSNAQPPATLPRSVEHGKESEHSKQAAEAWNAYKAADGTVYYYNQVTGESSWQRPRNWTGDESKTSGNPVPVSSERVPGTDWLEVVCEDGRKYYHKPGSGETTWHMPSEVESKRRLRLDPAKARMLERARAMGAQVAPEYHEGGGGGSAAEDEDDVTFTEEELGLGAVQRAQPATVAGAPPPAGLHPPALQQRHQVLPPSGPNPLLGAPPLLKRSPPPPLRPPLLGYSQAAHATQQHGAAPPQPSQPVPAPQNATRVATGYGPDGLMPKGAAVAAFKGLLSDRGVHAFSRYERELPKLQTDPRFKLLPTSSDRKAVFEEFCKEAGEKKVRAVAAPAAGRALAVPDAPAMKDGSLFFEQLLDEVQAACSGAGPPPGLSPAAGEEEGQLLPAWSEHLSLSDLEPLWGSDPRWQACSSEQRRMLLAARVAPLRQAASQHCEARYRTLLREKGVQADSRWSSMKHELAEDSRYQALSSVDREALFRRYTAELQKALDVQRERDEKQRDAERRLEVERRAAEKRQQQAAHADALTNYRALLQELHLTPNARWHEYRERVMRDPQGRGSNSALARGEAESLFRDHVEALYDAAMDSFLDLLEAELKPLLPSREQQGVSGLPRPLLRWREAQLLLEHDHRFQGLGEAHRERVWRRFVEDELWNRDNPMSRTRTQRRNKRSKEGGEGEETKAGVRRPRAQVMEQLSLDRAYQREYLEAGEPKRQRHEAPALNG